MSRNAPHSRASPRGRLAPRAALGTKRYLKFKLPREAKRVTILAASTPTACFTWRN